MKKNHNHYLNLAFNLAKINLGKTKLNPSVGCVIEKNGSVISSGYTSISGRPHAEFNALNKKASFKNTTLYVTMEPCTHYGITPPCTNLIIKKKIKNVYFSFQDVDQRTANKSIRLLRNDNIKVIKRKIDNYKNFYQSYFLNKKSNFPMIDAKIAISKDYFTINKKDRWITNSNSRRRAHLIRSEYDSIISTSVSINKDNSILNCRLNGFDINKPDLIVIDLNLDIKKNLNIFKTSKKRNILIVSSVIKSKKKEFLQRKGVKFVKIDSLSNKKDFILLFKLLKKKGYNRILVESGLTFLNQLIKKRLISNLYIFKSSIRLGKNGKNNVSANLLKKFKMKKKIKVNLNNDVLYKTKI
ncbi:bifunctional diaminohydroxyphosphoribosylaminopyrimidine deaminase/5-amino-6-(5-phosphoribosylamino)uracil reductase RibD [Candidatus Pelagibacter bacterium]|nr:bifunctional diaminohydroxyphosphoribosylaminopyrimidine deaminase/5-amino-6-(5-phosphoribosylamino)uracil reductase RibD [Candidatus Pelagibacter bacterium]MDA9624861.1 bifunctional diaminohydroxyphosphoribosylaminopyrimidine deaminase/5-amino-6-(5-phosphoribosylamino)uracil reductase RibD [Candidatus Pelagibacter bacterium]